MNQSAKEELANSISHGLGLVFGLVFLPFLCLGAVQDAVRWNGMPTVLYSFGFIFIFLSSTLYHTSSKPRTKKSLQKMDHIAIYFMIAGSYTPFIFECLEGVRAWIFFGVMWSFVLFGTIFKLFFTGKYDRISLFMYLGMGWMVLFIAKPFFEKFDTEVILLVAAGGLSYTLGTYFYSNDAKPYYHFIWHLFVLGGAILHYLAISSFVLGV